MIVTEAQIRQAYEAWRLADLGSKGADQYAILAAQDRETARATLETLIKNREVMQ